MAQYDKTKFTVLVETATIPPIRMAAIYRFDTMDYKCPYCTRDRKMHITFKGEWVEEAIRNNKFGIPLGYCSSCQGTWVVAYNLQQKLGKCPICQTECTQEHLNQNNGMCFSCNGTPAVDAKTGQAYRFRRPTNPGVWPKFNWKDFADAAANNTTRATVRSKKEPTLSDIKELYEKFQAIFGKETFPDVDAVTTTETTVVEYQGLWFDLIIKGDKRFCPCCEAEITVNNSIKFVINGCECGAMPVEAVEVQKHFEKANMARYRGFRTPSRTEATLVWEPLTQTYRLHFTFDKDFIDLIKTQVPSSDRSYDPKSHSWFIHERYFDAFKLLIEHKFDSVHIKTKEEYEKEQREFGYQVKPVNTNEELVIFLKLLEKAGVAFDEKETDGSVALKAYRRAALYFHPDRNPDRAPDMSSLNAAFQNLKPYFGLEQR